jgi:DNA-binding response OmpR family regulator
LLKKKAKPLRMLVWDAGDASADILKTILRRSGYEPLFVRGEGDFFDALEAYAFDAMLINEGTTFGFDFSLLKLVRLARLPDPPLPTILLAARTPEQPPEVDLCLVKPIDPRLLAHALAMLSEKAERRRHSS